jgi:hypothetical protein
LFLRIDLNDDPRINLGLFFRQINYQNYYPKGINRLWIIII